MVKTASEISSSASNVSRLYKNPTHLGVIWSISASTFPCKDGAESWTQTKYSNLNSEFHQLISAMPEFPAETGGTYGVDLVSH